MTTRRRALLGLAGLAVPSAAWAQPPKPTPVAPAPATKAKPAGKPGGKKVEKPATHTAPPPGSKPPGKPTPAAKLPTARAKPVPAAQGRPEMGTEAEPRPRGSIRTREDGPSLRPLDRELVRNWLVANPEWRPAGRQLPISEGRPLPPGLPRQPLPPELAMLLPYFPGYRYAAVGPDLVLYATGTEVVASLLAGALTR